MKTIASDYSRVPFFDSGKHDTDFFNQSTDLKLLYYEIAEEFAYIAKRSRTFAQEAWLHIQREGVNKVVFENKTLLSEKTYYNIKENKLPNPSLNTVMAICLGIGIRGFIADDLLLLAGYKLGNSLLHVTYRKFLHDSKLKDLSICQYNDILEGFCLPRLEPRGYNGIKADGSAKPCR